MKSEDAKVILVPPVRKDQVTAALARHGHNPPSRRLLPEVRARNRPLQLLASTPRTGTGGLAITSPLSTPFMPERILDSLGDWQGASLTPAPALQPMPTAEFRFYEELNDYLPAARRKCAFTRAFAGTPAVKDVIEALGVPHTEIDLILVDARSVRFAHRLRGGERVAVYPMFERFDIRPLHRLRPKPLRRTRFVADVHLGRLARYLRLLGFDTRYATDLDDAALISISVRERRILLTRDVGLLKHKALARGYWVRTTDADRQLAEIVRAFCLERDMQPFTRCMICNTRTRPIARAEVAGRVPPQVFRRLRRFSHCPGCGRVYWRGSHFRRLAVLSRRQRLTQAGRRA